MGGQEASLRRWPSAGDARSPWDIKRRKQRTRRSAVDWRRRGGGGYQTAAPSVTHRPPQHHRCAKTGGRDGLSARTVRRGLPAAGGAHRVDRPARTGRRRLQHLPVAAPWDHLPALCDPDLPAAVHPGSGAERLGLVLGHPRRAAGHRPLGYQRHPAEPDPRQTRLRSLGSTGAGWGRSRHRSRRPPATTAPPFSRTRG